MLKKSNFQIEYNRQGYYGLLNGEPLLSKEQHVIYAPNAPIIRLLYEELCQLEKDKINPEDGVIFRMISHAVDASRSKSYNTPINSLLQQDHYLQIQAKISKQRSADLFPVLTDILESHGLEQARLDKLNRKHWQWISSQLKGTDYWERSFLLEMGQKGYLILSLVFINNHLTIPLYSEYCLISQGLEPSKARADFAQFIKSHSTEFTYLRLLCGKSDLAQ